MLIRAARFCDRAAAILTILALIIAPGCRRKNVDHGIDAKISSYHASAASASFTVEIENGTPDDVFVYDPWVHRHFDEATKTLTVQFREIQYVNTGSSADCHCMIHPYVRIRPSERIALHEDVPLAWTAGKPGFPLIVDHVSISPIELAVQIAWSRVPLEAAPNLCNAERSERLLRLEQGVIEKRIRVLQ